jgi:hypothetical protein
MKIWTVLVGVKLQPDQHPRTPVIHKVGGYGSGSDISRGLNALADTRGRRTRRTNELLYEALRDQAETGNIAFAILAPRFRGRV